MNKEKTKNIIIAILLIVILGFAVWMGSSYAYQEGIDIGSQKVSSGVIMSIDRIYNSCEPYQLSFPILDEDNNTQIIEYKLYSELCLNKLMQGGYDGK